MTEEQKKEEIRWLYHRLDLCGQLIAEDDEWGAARREYNREYRRIIKALRQLEPEKWKDIPTESDRNNEKMAIFCKNNRCPQCGGEIKQTRSGSLRVVCLQCGRKYQLKKKKR